MNPFHSRIQGIEQEARAEVDRTIEMIRSSIQNLKDATEIVLKAQIVALETQRQLEKLAEENGMSNLITYCHQVLASL